MTNICPECQAEQSEYDFASHMELCSQKIPLKETAIYKAIMEKKHDQGCNVAGSFCITDCGCRCHAKNRKERTYTHMKNEQQTKEDTEWLPPIPRGLMPKAERTYTQEEVDALLAKEYEEVAVIGLRAYDDVLIAAVELPYHGCEVFIKRKKNTKK